MAGLVSAETDLTLRGKEALTRLWARFAVAPAVPDPTGETL